MAPKLSKEQREALVQSAGKPVRVEDDETHHTYVLVPMEAYQKVQSLLFDAGEFESSEAYPLIDETWGGPEGYDAPGMEMYDDYDAHRPPSCF